MFDLRGMIWVLLFLGILLGVAGSCTIQFLAERIDIQWVAP